MTVELALTQVSPEHQNAFTKMLEHFSSQQIFAVIGYGSYFCGGYGPNSDIDIFVVSRSNAYERVQLIIDGLRFEVTHVSGKRFQMMVEKNNAVLINALPQSAVLYEVNGIANQIIEQAKQLFNAGPAEHKQPNFKVQIRSRTTTLLEDLKDEQDEANAHILTAQLINVCFSAVCFKHSLWKQGGKYVLKQTQQVEPEIATMMRELLTCSHQAERIPSAVNLVQQVLEPLGGVLQAEEVVYL